MSLAIVDEGYAKTTGCEQETAIDVIPLNNTHLSCEPLASREHGLVSIMNTKIMWISAALTAAALMVSVAKNAGAQKYSNAQMGISFTYPLNWKVIDNGSRACKITAPDGYEYLLQMDSFQANASDSATGDVELLNSIESIASKLSPKASLTRTSAVSMDHAQGAVFRFSSGSDQFDVWLALFTGHIVTIMPIRTGEPYQTIGLSTIMQTLAMSDPRTLPSSAPSPPIRPRASQPTSTQPVPPRVQTVSFRMQILPLLNKRCLACHNASAPSGGLDVSSYENFMSASDHGSVIAAGDPTKSPLLDYLTGVKDQMPKGSEPLSTAEIKMFKTWIQEGASNDIVRANTTAASTAVTNARIAVSSPGVTAHRASGRFRANPMISYTGHIANNDSSFNLILFTDGAASADWSFTNTGATYVGTYEERSGVYDVMLDLKSGSIPNHSRSLHILMQQVGVDITGKFSMDSTPPGFRISSLQVDNMYGVTKVRTGGAPARNAAANAAARKQARQTIAQLRRQQRALQRAVKQAQRNPALKP